MILSALTLFAYCLIQFRFQRGGKGHDIYNKVLIAYVKGSWNRADATKSFCTLALDEG